MKLALGLGAAVGAMLAAPLAADAQVYVRGGGSVLAAEDLGQGVGVEGAFGYAWSNGLRAEISADTAFGMAVQPFTQGAFTTSETDVDVMAAFAAVFYDFPTEGALRPYVGAGAGMGLLSADNLTFSTATNFTGTFEAINETGFAWFFGGGLTWRVSESMGLDIGYRYMDLGETTFSGFASTSDPGPPPTASAIEGADIPGAGSIHSLKATLRLPY